MKTKVIRGGWVLTMAEGKAPIKDGMVKIVGEKIAAVAPWKDQQLIPTGNWWTPVTPLLCRV